MATLAQLEIPVTEGTSVTNQTYDLEDTEARTGVSTINGKIPSSASSSNKMATASDITGITDKIPSGASSSNKMATASDVAAKISWADAGKSVKKNYVDLLKTTALAANSTITNLTKKGFTFSNSVAGVYVSTKTPLSLEVGKAYTATANITAFNGNDGRIALRNSSDVIKKSVVISSTGKATLDIDNYAEGDYLSFFANMGTSGTYSMTVDEVMVRPASIIDDTYEEPIPDNTELMTWEANAKTGVHNQADLSKTGGSTGLTISDITDNGFTIGFPTGSYPATRTPLDLIVGEQYTLSFKCVSTTNNNVKGGIRDNDSLFKITAGPLVAGTSYSVDFTYAAGDKIAFFINGSADSTSTAVITDIVVKPKEDTSNLVTPYAMTNRELTEKVQGKLDKNNYVDTIAALIAKIPNNQDAYVGIAENTVMATLTNNSINTTGKITAFHFNVSTTEYLDWWALMSSNQFAIGRYNMTNNSYVSHTVLTS